MRLAVTVGRLDFWNISFGRLAEELTDYELALWRAYEIIEPYGDRRADMRMALQTLSLMQIQCTTEFSADQKRKIVSGLLCIGRDEEEEQVTPEQAAKQASIATNGK